MMIPANMHREKKYCCTKNHIRMSDCTPTPNWPEATTSDDDKKENIICVDGVGSRCQSAIEKHAKQYNLKQHLFKEDMCRGNMVHCRLANNTIKHVPHTTVGKELCKRMGGTVDTTYAATEVYTTCYDDGAHQPPHEPPRVTRQKNLHTYNVTLYDDTGTHDIDKLIKGLDTYPPTVGVSDWMSKDNVKKFINDTTLRLNQNRQISELFQNINEKTFAPFNTKCFESEWKKFDANCDLAIQLPRLTPFIRGYVRCVSNMDGGTNNDELFKIFGKSSFKRKHAKCLVKPCHPPITMPL